MVLRFCIIRISSLTPPIVQGRVEIDPKTFLGRSPQYNKPSTAAIMDVRARVIVERCQTHRSYVFNGDVYVENAEGDVQIVEYVEIVDLEGGRQDVEFIQRIWSVV